MHRQHRQSFLEVLAREGAAAVVASGAPRVRNHDSEHRFRPASDFWYLTGFDEPEAVLVLAPRADARATLFLRPKDREQEVWSGRRLGVEGAVERLGVDEAFPIDELAKRLPGLLAGHESVVYRLGEDEERDAQLLAAQRACQRRRSREGARAPLAWVDPSRWLHELRLVKSAAELEVMRRAAAVSVEAHRLAMRAAAPGRNECEVDALLGYTFRRHGCTGAAYESIVAGGANACILHYTRNDQPLCAGELLLVDAGAERDYYASDVTRTFPVDGRFTPEQRALYEVVLDAQRQAILAVRPGARFVDPHRVATRRLAAGLLELGLLQGSLDEVCESEAHVRFTIHRTSHWLGLDVHDCGAYFAEGASRRLEPGMVLTVEPGLYVAPDDTTVEPRWRGIGIRIEDDVAVTADGREVLTAALPTEADEVEAVCQDAVLEPVG